MDGFRAYWNGERLLSKQGKDIGAPKEFTQGLPPAIPLDGELWLGRGTFESLISTLRSQPADWSDVRYYIYDMPASDETFKDRMMELKQIPFPQYVNTFIFVCDLKVHRVAHIVCRGNNHLLEELELISQLGGEGLMANNPDVTYEIGRTNSIFKIKVFTDQDEISNSVAFSRF